MSRSVYELTAFSARVNYSAQCIRRGTWGGRHFDTCFEMGDGNYIVAALVRKAEHDNRLAANLYRAIREDACRKHAAEFAHLDNRELCEAAIKHVLEEQREYAAASL